MTKAQYGTGTMTEREPGVWRLRVYVGRDPVTGSPRQVSRTFRGKPRAARDALNLLIAEVNSGDRPGTSAPLSRLLTDWMRQGEALKAKSTIETYQTHIKARILPDLGDIPLNRLDTYTIQMWANRLSEDLSPKTVKLVFSVLAAALEQGVVWKFIPENPSKGVKLPRQEKVDRTRLTDATVNEIIRSAMLDDPDLGALIDFATMTGLRRGELCGLQWGDVDWDGATITVQRQIVPGKGGQHVTPGTKTHESRTIGIPHAINDLKFRYASKRAEFGEIPDNGWIFSHDDGTTPMRAKSVTEFWTKHARAAGVNARLHDTRHLAVSKAVSAGMDVTTAAHYFGHTPQIMLEIYSSAVEDKSEAMGAALRRQNRPGQSQGEVSDQV